MVLAGADLNVTGAAVQSFSDNNPSPAFELNAAVNPSMVRVEVPFDSVNKDQGRSQTGAFEFHHRVVTYVEDDLLAWYTMDDFNGSLVHWIGFGEEEGMLVIMDWMQPFGGGIARPFQFSCNLGLKCFRQHRQRGKEQQLVDPSKSKFPASLSVMTWCSRLKS